MEATKVRKDPPYALGFLALSFFFVFAAYFFANTRFLLPASEGGIDDIGFYSAALALFALAIGVYIFARKRFCFKDNWVWASVLSLFFLFSLIGLFSFSGYPYEGALYVLGGKSLFRVFVRTFLLFLSIYCFVAVLPFLSRGRDCYILLYRLVSLTCLIAIVYSFVAEWDIYLGALTEEDFDFAHFALKSFTDNRNSYGFLLFLGIVSESFLLLKKPNGASWFLLFFYYGNLYFPFSKTSLVLALFFIFCFLVYRLVLKARRHWFKAVFPLFLFLLIHGVVALLVYTKAGPYFGTLNKFLRNVLLSDGGLFEFGAGSFFARMEQLRDSVSLLSARSVLSFLFGFGNINGANVYFAFKGDPFSFRPIDSGWAMNLLEGGIFGLVFSFGLYLSLFGIIVRALARKEKDAWPSLFLFVCFLARTFMEAGDMTYLSWAGISLYAFLFVPLKSEHEYRKRLSLGLESESDYLPSKPRKRNSLPSVSFVLFLSSFIFVPFLSAFFGFSSFGVPFFSSVYNFFSAFLLYIIFSFSLAFGVRFIAEKRLWPGLLFLSFGFGASLSVCLCLPFLSDVHSFIVASSLFVPFVALSIAFRFWKLLSKEWVTLSYFLSFGIALVFAFSLLNYSFAESVTAYSIFGEMLVCFAFYFLRAFFLEYMGFPLLAVPVEERGERIRASLAGKKVARDLRGLS